MASIEGTVLSSCSLSVSCLYLAFSPLDLSLLLFSICVIGYNQVPWYYLFVLSNREETNLILVILSNVIYINKHINNKH